MLQLQQSCTAYPAAGLQHLSLPNQTLLVRVVLPIVRFI